MVQIVKVIPAGGHSTVQVVLDSGESLRLDADSLIDHERAACIVLRATRKTLAMPADRTWKDHINDLWLASVYRGEVI